MEYATGAKTTIYVIGGGAAILSGAAAGTVGYIGGGSMTHKLFEMLAPQMVQERQGDSEPTLGDLDTKEKETFTLVFPELADIADNKLSVLAPVGTAILGQRVGDVLRWRVPDGWRRLKVKRVLYQPEREGVFHA